MLEVLKKLFSIDEKQAFGFEGLLKMTAPAAMQQSFESHLDTLEHLVITTQKEWLRKEGTERWDQIDSEFAVSNRISLLNLFNQFGLLVEKKPKLKKYDCVLLLGATQVSVEGRLNYLALLWDQGVRFNQLVLLGGQRPLMRNKESIADFLKEGSTEIDMMTELVKEKQLKAWPIELSEISVLSVNTPLQAGGGRPTTSDTINAWLEKTPRPGRILAISNQPHINYQESVLANALQRHIFPLEVVGPAAAESVKISVVLDALARHMYVEYPRVKAEFEQENLHNQVPGLDGKPVLQTEVSYR